MRKIINGLLYDTDKPEVIYEERWCEKYYYRTLKGNYFLYQKNRAKIIPMTEEEFKDYLIDADYDTYCDLFGDPDEA